jgi:hypothetical protein
MISVDGLNCSSECLFPEISRKSASANQCYPKCEGDEIRIQGQGCALASECTGFISE